MTSEMFIAFILYEHRAGAHDVPCFFVGVSLGRAEHSLAGRRGGSKALHLIRECTHEPAQNWSAGGEESSLGPGAIRPVISILERVEHVGARH